VKKSLKVVAVFLTSLACSRLAGGAEVPATGGDRQTQEVHGLDLGGRNPLVSVARDKDAWDAVKRTVGELQKAPEGRPKPDHLDRLDGTDFRTQMIVAVFWGEMEFSGHGEKCWIEDVTTDKGEVLVDCRASLWGGHVFRSYRAWPFHVKVVPRSELPVRFTQATEVKGTPLAVLKAGEWKQELPRSGR
jgi:hypothetical protein